MPILTTIEPDAFGPWALLFGTIFILLDALTRFVQHILPILLALPGLAVWFGVRLRRRAR